MEMKIDFMKDVQWADGWETDAFKRLGQYVLDTLKPPNYLLPFSFQIWTDEADQLAVDLAASHFQQETIEIDGGPLGGGTYFLIDPTATICAILPDGTPDYGYGECIDFPQLGKPASFTLMLTGKPKDGEWLSMMKAKYRLVERII